jgi:disintegrin and metalloproteinase domain-containing protein 17
MQQEENERDREKRQVAYAQTSSAQSSPRKDTCPLLLVADYRFFSSMGQGSLSRTTNYLVASFPSKIYIAIIRKWLQIGLIDRVDSLYRKTNFSNDFSGMGFEIKEVCFVEFQKKFCIHCVFTDAYSSISNGSHSRKHSLQHGTG